MTIEPILIQFSQPRLRSALVVLVVATERGTRLVAPTWRAVEPLVHAPEPVQPACVRLVGVVDDAVLERERAHARCAPAKIQDPKSSRFSVA
jgi:hypothetical protein